MDLKEFVSKYKVLLIIFAIIIVALLQQGGFFELFQGFAASDTKNIEMSIPKQVVNKGEKITVDLIGDIRVRKGWSGYETRVGYITFLVVDGKIKDAKIGVLTEDGDKGPLLKGRCDEEKVEYCPKRFARYEIQLEEGLHNISIIYFQADAEKWEYNSNVRKCGIDVSNFYDVTEKLAENMPCKYWEAYKNSYGFDMRLVKKNIIGENADELYNSLKAVEGETYKYKFENVTVYVLSEERCFSYRDCVWCGEECVLVKPGLVCPYLIPPKDYSCVCENGVCKKKYTPRECRVDSDCGNIPIENGIKVGKCVEGSCSYEIICTSGYTLKDGKCVRVEKSILDIIRDFFLNIINWFRAIF